jgi:hypothetical protein
MKWLVATTGPPSISAAGAAVFEAGGNAIDAAVAAVLAWPPALSSAGGMVVVGHGLGRGSCLFAARNPGFGLSRPRRMRLLESREPAALVAAPCAGKAFAAMISRWGTITLPVVARAAARAAEDAGLAPHLEALELLAQEGPLGLVRGAWGELAARVLGPQGGGLLTRRDLTEARPEIGEAFGPVGQLWLAAGPDRVVASGRSTPADQRAVSVAALDRRGAVVAMVLEVGSNIDPAPPPVMGVEPNTLLAGQPTVQIKKVGQPVPLRVGAAAGGEEELVAMAGHLPTLRAAMADERIAEVVAPAGLLMLRARGEAHVEVRGASHVEQS